MDSYEAQFEGLYRVAYRVAYRMVGRPEAAEDVAQESLARALVNWKKLEKFDDAAPWVARVAGNLVIGAWRHQRLQVSHDAATGGAVEDAGLRIDLSRALLRLPRRQRQVVVMRYLADLSERSVAEALGCSTGTVKQHASRGLAALRSAIPDLSKDQVSTDVRPA